MKTIRKIMGIILLIAVVLGMGTTVFGFAMLPRIKAQVEAQAGDNLTLILDALGATQETLSLANTSLNQSAEALETLNLTLGDVGQTLEDTDPLIESIVVVMSESMPEMVNATQTSLESAQSSAVVIDNMLYSLDSISFLTGIEYDPDVPLADSIIAISESMDTLEPAFDTIGDNLAVTQANLSLVSDSVDSLADNIADIGGTLADSTEIIEQYDEVLLEVRTDIDTLNNQFPGWINKAAWGVSFFLFWLIVIQIGMLFQALEMLGVGQPGEKGSTKNL